MKKRYKLLLAAAVFSAGAGLTLLLSKTVALPQTSMLLEIVNESANTIPTVEIQFGNQNSQETILALQIVPGETRTLTLNHQPGMGFNFTTRIDGEDITICAGKFSESRGLRQTIRDSGEIVESDI
jgi:hypothetical protein